MQQVEVFTFFTPPEGKQRKPRRSRWKMTVEDGKKHFPNGWPDLGSKEIRTVLDTEEEIQRAKANWPSGGSGPATEESVGRSLREYDERMRIRDGNRK